MELVLVTPFKHYVGGFLHLILGMNRLLALLLKKVKNKMLLQINYQLQKYQLQVNKNSYLISIIISIRNKNNYLIRMV